MNRYISIMLAMFLAASCARDLGNYKYHGLDTPSVSGIDTDISVLTQERLLISPSIENGLSPEQYEYEWKAIDKNMDMSATVIGTERDLDYIVTLAPAEYSLYYKITEKETGIYWMTEANMTVSSSMTTGWMVLCSDSGASRLDFISDVTGLTYTDVLKDNKDMPKFNGPRKIHWQNTMADANSPYYLFTDDGATRLGKDSFEWEKEYSMMYEMATMENVSPYSMVSAGFGRMFVSGTDAYYCETMGIAGLFGSPVNKGFRVAPYIGANVSGIQYAAVHLLYDMDNRRFMAYCPLLAKNDLGAQEPLARMDEMGKIAEGLAKEGEASVVGTAFDRYPEGYDLIYMENTLYDPGNGKMGITYSILADGDRRYVYGIQLGDMLRFADCTYVLGKACYGDISGCQGITDGNAIFAFSSLKGYMYYAIGDTVYCADLNAGPIQSTPMIRLAGERITMLKFNLYRQASNSLRSYDLVVGSEKEGAGTLRIYEGYESDGDFSNVTPKAYSGFASIVDATYKERIN
ncbi:MAG: PKD-like family lipoprotein [Clostridium sp.]|nr:PKD-like family lipoprotein [Bacteroides sp.]MCM1198976.1 PKD-like family lipoprotein [Clostridium sp.]